MLPKLRGPNCCTPKIQSCQKSVIVQLFASYWRYSSVAEQLTADQQVPCSTHGASCFFFFFFFQRGQFPDNDKAGAQRTAGGGTCRRYTAQEGQRASGGLKRLNSLGHWPAGSAGLTPGMALTGRGHTSHGNSTMWCQCLCTVDVSYISY